MMERRQVLAIVLMFLVLALYQIFYVERFQKKKVKRPAITEVAKEKPPALPPPPPKVEAPAPVRAGAGAKSVRVVTSLYEATFSARGAALTSFKLSKYPLKPGKGEEPVDLVLSGERALLVAFDDPSMNRSSTEEVYAVSAESLELTKANPSGEISFTYTGPKGFQVTKRFTFHDDKYAFDLDLYVKSPGGRGRPLDHRVLWAFGLGGGAKGYGAYTTVSHLLAGGKKPKTDKPGKLPPLSIMKGTAIWSAIQTKYFTAILAPRDGTAAVAVAKRTREKTVTSFRWLALRKETSIRKVAELAPGLAFASSGGAARERILIFGGPKLSPRLKAYGADIERVIDYGWFGPISRPLLKVLRLINGFIGNFGVSIILLTIIVKGIFYPLSIKQHKSMAQMSKLQPKLKALQERYKGDKQKLNEETMALYKREKVNPLGGCLPMLIQFPVIIALYRVLGDALDLRGAPFVFWIDDLSVPDSLFFPWFHVLPVLMGVMMLLQNHIAPASAMGGAGGDPRQQQMFKYMPIIFLFIFWGFPAGLNLYWTVYTVLGIAEQLLIKRHLAASEA